MRQQTQHNRNKNNKKNERQQTQHNRNKNYYIMRKMRHSKPNITEIRIIIKWEKWEKMRDGKPNITEIRIII